EHLHTTGVLPRHERIVLPSEAQWECAAGNRRGDPYPWGDQPDPERANIRATGLAKVIEPGRFSPAGDSVAGCQDLIGNVWEWTRSIWGGSARKADFGYPYDPADGREDLHSDPTVRRVIRGGAFYYAVECANSYTRNQMPPGNRHPAGGFRVAVVSPS